MPPLRYLFKQGFFYVEVGDVVPRAPDYYCIVTQLLSKNQRVRTYSMGLRKLFEIAKL